MMLKHWNGYNTNDVNIHFMYDYTRMVWILMLIYGHIIYGMESICTMILGN